MFVQNHQQLVLLRIDETFSAHLLTICVRANIHYLTICDNLALLNLEELFDHILSIFYNQNTVKT
jgi:hypothetical protein